MNPSASMIDGEAEVTQHMEVSMSDCIKLPTKRKAEVTQQVEASSMSDCVELPNPTKRKAETSMVADAVEGEGGREEEEKDSADSDQVWDVDSFASDYESPDEAPSDSDEFQMRRYLRHLYVSGGFLLEEEMVPKNLFQGWRRLNLDLVFQKPNITGRDFMKTMAQVAIDKYNQTKNKTVTLDHVVRAVIRMSIGVKAYITFMAKESPEGELVEYQAKAEIRVWQTKIHPILCRPTPTSSSSSS